MVRPHRTLAVALSVTAALGAGAVMSAAQSSPAPTLPGVPPECTTPLPNPAGGQPATFLKVQGLQGESEVDSFRFGASKPGDTGPLAPRTFVIGKAFDKASPQLLTRLANGQHISSVVDHAEQAGGHVPALHAARSPDRRLRAHGRRGAQRRAAVPAVQRGRGRVPAAAGGRLARPCCAGRRPEVILHPR